MGALHSSRIVLNKPLTNQAGEKWTPALRPVHSPRMVEVLGESGGELARSVWKAYSTRDRTLLTVGSIVCYLVFRFVGKTFGIPQIPHYQASLLMNPTPTVAIVLTAVTLVACVLIGSLVAGVVHFEGGLFCAVVGMLALSTRGGPM